MRESILMHELALRGPGSLGTAQLARLITPLERMANYLFGRESAEYFVQGFGDEWWRLQFGRMDPDLDSIWDDLEKFYEQIHLFTSNPESRAEEPLFFDADHLRALTRTTFERAYAKWMEAAKALPAG